MSAAPGDTLTGQRVYLLGSGGLGRNKMEQEKRNAALVAAPKTGGSIITGEPRSTKKRIYGMGKTTGQKSSGTVKKPKLGGE